MRDRVLGSGTRRAGDLGDGDYDGLLSEETRQALADLIERNRVEVEAERAIDDQG